MKPFSLLKIPVLFVGLGAVLLFSPTCKAQSEVNPDHFDGTDPWEAASRKPVTAKANSTLSTASYQAQNHRASSGASIRLAAVEDTSNPVPRNAVAVQDRRKTAVRKSDKK